MRTARLWRTRAGQLITPACMTCEHLRNAVALILRKRWRMQWLSILLAEIDRRCKPIEPPDEFEPDTVISGMDSYGVLPD